MSRRDDSSQKAGMGLTIITASIVVVSLIPSFMIFKQVLINCLISIKASSSHMTCGILVPQSEIEPKAPSSESPNNWTTREFQDLLFLSELLFYSCSRILFELSHVVFMVSSYSQNGLHLLLRKWVLMPGGASVGVQVQLWLVNCSTLPFGSSMWLVFS